LFSRFTIAEREKSFFIYNPCKNLRGENADLRKALDDACKYIDRLKRVQVKTPKTTKRETVTI